METYTVKEAAERIGVSERRIQRAYEKHGIGIKRAGSIFFTVKEIARLRVIMVENEKFVGGK